MRPRHAPYLFFKHVELAYQRGAHDQQRRDDRLRARWPATSSRTRPAKLRGVVLPTFSPKLRKVNGPRHQKCRSMFVMLISDKTSRS
jgi:hypothetical protein